MRYRRAYVEISNVCNLKCDFCPTVERKDQVMDLVTFERIAREVQPFVDEICLHLMGEPLGHPDFPACIEVCARLGLPVSVTTNGTLLTGPRREALLDPIVRQVNVSVQSFEANFGEQDPKAYLARVFSFTREALTRRPDLYVNFRLWDLDDPAAKSERNSRVRAAIEEEFQVSFADFKVDVRRRKGHRLTGRVSVHFDSRFTWPSPSLPLRSETGFCHGLSSHFGVHADGTVVPCCLDKEAAVPLGNCKEQSLPDLLTSPKANAIRDGFARGELVEDLCRRCTFISRFDKKARRISS
jgi:radical SAM protein with 4Fe4S-binding SPASM domain